MADKAKDHNSDIDKVLRGDVDPKNPTAGLDTDTHVNPGVPSGSETEKPKQAERDR